MAAHASDPRFLVIHGLRLKGFAEGEAVAAMTGLSTADIEPVLKELGEAELAKRREGRVSGWALTPAGRDQHAALVADELGAAGARDVVDGCYHRFLDVNQEMLAVCTAWQLREDQGAQALNDHSDAAYDNAVIERLASIDERVQPVCDDLAGALERFTRYGARLTDALEKVRSGDHEWFTKPVIDSYHTVWFELHEDLLTTLGIERASEGQG